MKLLRLLALVLTLGASAACDATEVTSVSSECPTIGSGSAGCI